MFGFFTYQLTELFTEFYSYPVKTSVTLKYSPLQMPAVTVCNMNPFKDSSIEDLDSDLGKILYGESTDADTDDIDGWSVFDNFNSNESTSYLYDDLSDIPEDDFEVWRENVQVVFRKIPSDEREKMGTRLEDFIHTASFSNRLINPTLFPDMYKTIRTTEFGNCFTLDHRDIKSKRSGRVHGLKLILNLEKSEYIEHFSVGFGVRLVIHEPGTYPLPDREGITLNPAFETNIGIKLVNINRLGGLYSNCTDGQRSFGELSATYTEAACYAYCEMMNVRTKCNCISFRTPDIWDSLNSDVCEDVLSTASCMQNTLDEIDNGRIKCDCKTRCHQKAFTAAVSGRKWPNTNYLEKVLLKQSCKKNITSMYDICDSLTASGNTSVSGYEDNFLSVNVYYEDLNHEIVTEEPLYNAVRFMSDIGGTMGLYVGASVLTYVELLQLILEVVLYFRQKVKRQPATTTVQHLEHSPNF